jgi:hypothetical protein
MNSSEQDPNAEELERLEEELARQARELELKKQKLAEKKKAKAKEHATKEAEKTCAEHNERIAEIDSLLRSVPALEKERAELKAIVKANTRTIENKYGIITEHETAVNQAVGCKSYIPNHILDEVLKNPTHGIQLSCRLGGDFCFEGPVPYLLKVTDLSLEVVLKHDDPTKSDIVRTKAGLQYIIKKLYASSASINTHVKVRKLA